MAKTNIKATFDTLDSYFLNTGNMKLNKDYFLDSIYTEIDVTFRCDKQMREYIKNTRKVPFQYYDNGQSVNIYINNTITYSLNYKTFYDVKFITSIYSKNGLVKEYPFSYDSEICKELERKHEA